MHDFKKIPEWPVAIEAIQKAAQLTESVRQSFDSATLDKNDKSPVTIADFGAQALVLKTMMTAFPGDLCVAEEDSNELTKAENSETLKKLTAAVRGVDSSYSTDTILSAIDLGNDTGGSEGRIWTLDPIDGTKGFLRNDQYAIALGLMEAGEAEIWCPRLPEFAHGFQGSDRPGRITFLGHPWPRRLHGTD
jgi:3'(2'), 5'-bisphosphate nucleotidase